jgi:hypothetical protein
MENHYKTSDWWTEWCGSPLTITDLYFVIFLILFVILPCTLLYFAIRRASSISLVEQKFWGKEILIVIAHPGDEAKYFTPAIIQLSAYNTVKILSLSGGLRTCSRT